MDGLASAFSLSSEQVIQVMMVVLVVIIALFVLRFVVDVAVTVLRTAMWIGAIVIVIYIVYSLVR